MASRDHESATIPTHHVGEKTQNADFEESLNSINEDDEVTLACSSDDDDETIAEKPTTSSPGPSHPFDNKNTEHLRAKIIAVTEERKKRTHTAFSKAMKAAAWVITPTPSEHERTLLCFACSALNIDRVVNLIDAGVPINADATFGHGALMAVIRAKPTRLAAQEAMIDFLVAEGANVNYLGKDRITPLSAAVEEGYTQLARRLLDLGANINDRRTRMTSWRCRVGQGMTALNVAVSKRHSECFRLLVERGADPNLAFRLSNCIKEQNFIRDMSFSMGTWWLDGVTPLHLAAVDDKGYVKELLGFGADMMARDSRGRTPFHWAVEEVSMEAIMLFIGRGYPVDDPGEHGVTALDMVCAALERGAKSQEYPALTKELLQAGANPEIVYPQNNLSIKARWLLMDDYRDTYAPIFRSFHRL